MSAVAAPLRSDRQRREALDRANQVRSFRARLKVRLGNGDESVIPILIEPVPELATMKIMDLLLCIPKVGIVKANKTLAKARVSPSKTVAGLSPRQRDELLYLVRTWTR